MKKGTPITTNIICDYGCGQQAHFVFVNKKYCCEEIVRRCPILKEKYLKGAKQTRAKSLEFDPETGLTKAQIRYQKATETKKNTVLDDGRTMWEYASQTAKKTKNKIGSDGLTAYERGGIKSYVTKKNSGIDIIAIEKMKRTKLELSSDGKTKAFHVSMKAQNTKKNTIVDGKNMASHGAYKAAQTRRNTVVEGGITMQERAISRFKSTIYEVQESGLTKAQERSKKSTETRIREHKFNGGLRKINHEEVDIFYQGSYEKHYLDTLIASQGADWVRTNVVRGNAIRYYDFYRNSSHWYIPDFIVADTLVEIKAIVYWDRPKDISWLVKGFCKLEAAYALYPVKLILEKVEHDWSEFRNGVINQLRIKFPNEELLDTHCDR